MVSRSTELFRAAGPAAAPPHLSSPRRTIGVVGCGQVEAPAPRHPLPTRWLAYLPVALLIAGCNNSQAKRHAIEQMITQELPAGLSTSQVIAFLDSHHITHYGYDAKKHVIHARAELGGAIVKQALHIIFNFDGNGKLVSHEVEEWLTGP